jgi:hypothetical protein
MIGTVQAIELCTETVEPLDIPCNIVSTWNYTPPCNSYYAILYNSSGYNLLNFTMDSYGDSGLCYFTFNQTVRDSYSFVINNGDTGNINVSADNMEMGIVFGIGIIVSILMFLAFKLDDSHSLLRLLFIFESITLIGLIPAAFIIPNITTIFYKMITFIIVSFWIYVGCYIIYWILKKLNLIVAGEK